MPPCFIVVCNNTAASKLVYDYISGFYREKDDGSRILENGRLGLFGTSTTTATRSVAPTPSSSTASSSRRDALDPGFRKMAAPEIERFRQDIIERTGDRRQPKDSPTRICSARS